jgi:REP element-mobilizing transposase RayT
MNDRNNGVRIRSRGKLPHLEKQGGIYFVTFRLAGSLPKSVVDRIVQKRAIIANKNKGSAKDSNKRYRKGLYIGVFDEYDEYLNTNRGALHLRIREISNLVKEALLFFDNKKYILMAWAIMPNHVHVLIKPFGDHSLSGILHSWKSYTSKKANKILNRKGSFWAKEYYDHLIRDERELFQVIKYIKENPSKAGLHNWNWVGITEDFNII